MSGDRCVSDRCRAFIIGNPVKHTRCQCRCVAQCLDIRICNIRHRIHIQFFLYPKATRVYHKNLTSIFYIRFRKFICMQLCRFINSPASRYTAICTGARPCCVFIFNENATTRYLLYPVGCIRSTWCSSKHCLYIFEIKAIGKHTIITARY